ncbi:MAG: ABC transporter ATP-binding protein/permease, partial [Bacteroidota bacterium]|nr:ABC transporter ATP-binding protein/permease [Bacteroidota bacterium]
MKQLLKDMFEILTRDEKRKLWILALADIFISVLDIVFLIVLLYLINFYIRGGHKVSNKYISLQIFDQQPVLPIAVFFLLFTIKNVFAFIVSKHEYNFVYRVASRISRDNLLLYLNGSYTDYVYVDSSIINRKISQQPIEFSHYILNGIQQVFSQAVLVTITLITLLIFKPLLAPLLVIFLSPPLIWMALFMKRKLHTGRLIGKKISEKSMQHLQEALSGYIESNIYLKNDYFTGRYHKFQSQLNHYLSERLIIQTLPSRIIEVFAVFGLFVLILVNFFISRTNSIPLITIGAFLMAAYKIIPGVVKITNLIGQIKTYKYTTGGLVGPGPLIKKDPALIKPLFSIVLDSIYYSYKERNVLNGFSLTLRRGDMVGITGISGKGKTTLVNILLGFLSPDSGTISLNGHATDAELRRHHWSRISYIKQQYFFLHASVVE